MATESPPDVFPEDKPSPPPTSQGAPPATAGTNQTAAKDSGTGPAVKAALGRTFSSANRQAAGKVATSFGKTVVSMHPLWLMGEAITGKKAGTHFKKNSSELVQAGESLRDLLATSASDVVIIVNEQLRHARGSTSKAGTDDEHTKEEQDATVRTADIIKRAGDNAIVVVAASIERAQKQLHSSSPELKKSIVKNGREVVVVIDKGLKNPIVITGVHKFAKARGIPHPEAILTLASLALSKVLAAIPEVSEEVPEDGRVDELDATELARTSSQEAENEASEVVKEVERGQKEGVPPPKEGQQGKHDGKCIIA